MAFSRFDYLGLGVLFCLFANWASCAKMYYVSFESDAFRRRSLLQAKSSCDIDFENQNYTILTSRCKGPRYTPETCCSAFKDFACPFAGKLNNEKSDCATTMFSYINLYGKYPPGLFANECKEGKNGLDCSNVNAGHNASGPSSEHSNPSNGLRLVPSMAMICLLVAWIWWCCFVI